MKKKSKNIEETMKKVVNKLADSELYEWPPQCATFLYQPLRPCSRDVNHEKKMLISDKDD